MTKKIPIAVVVLFMQVAFLQAYQSAGVPKNVDVGSTRVERLLEDIAKSSGSASGKERSEIVPESELNAYIARQIVESGEKYIVSLRLKLTGRDKVEGRLVLDLRTLSLPSGLVSGAEVLFGASFESGNGWISIKMEKVFIGGQPVAPQVIDSVIAIASRASGYKPVRLGDRHKLPTGVKRLSAGREKLYLYY